MTEKEPGNNAYLYCLDEVTGGRVYYRVFAAWTGWEKHRREKRKPTQIIEENAIKVLRLLGTPCLEVNHPRDLAKWVRSGGWMVAPSAIVQQCLVPLLKTCTCVKSPMGLFWDERLGDGRARRRPTKQVRALVLLRDGHRCVLCGANADPNDKLTMDHVIPHSKGGDSTGDNLVTLCERHNNNLGNSDHSYLFRLAGLHHGWDRSLLKVKPTIEDADRAAMISNNVMVSSCLLRKIDAFKSA